MKDIPLLKVTALLYFISMAIAQLIFWVSAYLCGIETGYYQSMMRINQVGEAHIELIIHIVGISASSVYAIDWLRKLLQSNEPDLKL